MLLSIPAAIITASFVEWIFHKHVLHGLGKKKDSIWNGHWYDHHKVARKNNMADAHYAKPLIEQMKTPEFIAITGVCLSLIPAIKLSPLFVTTLILYGVTYYIVHAKSHIDTDWAEKYLSHHVKHHMKGNQSKNWCVVIPLADMILRTNQPI